jgi:hypothetical protein
MATHAPDSTQAESRVKRFARWGRHAKLTTKVYLLPYAQIVLAQLAFQLPYP